MSELAERATGDRGGDAGRRPEPVDPYLACWVMTGEQRRWPLRPDSGGVTVGRSSSNDVCIDWDPQVSRVHASLERMGGQWTLADDGLSRNGTFVNGVRLSSRVRLRDRDQIRVGGTVLVYCAPPQTAEQTIVGDALPTNVRLTGAQRSVLLSLCGPYREGRPYAAPASNQRIAEELFLSIDAVKTHLRTLFHKFGIEHLPQNQKRARLVELALQSGLVPDNEARPDLPGRPRPPAE